MIKRTNYLEDLENFKDKNLTKIVTGIRRCGKSTLFELFHDYLIVSGICREQIISVNLEDGDFRNIKTADLLYEYVESKLNKDMQNYIFLDEVQQVEGF